MSGPNVGRRRFGPLPLNSMATMQRKRAVRRRRAQLGPKSTLMPRVRELRTRPWSFHQGDWTDWDYYTPPILGLAPPLNSPEDPPPEGFAYEKPSLFDREDPALRKLIEFGENYENWFRVSEDEILRSDGMCLSPSFSLQFTSGCFMAPSNIQGQGGREMVGCGGSRPHHRHLDVCISNMAHTHTCITSHGCF